MGSHTSLSQVSLLLAVLCALTTSLAAARSEEISRCGLGRYWRSDLQRCADCTVCSGPGREVTLRPCSAVRDTQCGAVSDLHIDWSWMHAQQPQAQPQPQHASHASHARRKNGGADERISAVSEAEALLRDELRHLPPQQQRQRDRVIDFGDDYVLPDHPRQPLGLGPARRQRKPKGRQPKPLGFYDDFADFGASGEGLGVGDPVSDDEDLARESWRRVHSRHRTPPTASAPTTTTTSTTTTRPTTRVSLVEDFIVVKEEGDARPQPDVVVATTPSFTTAETLVWDWQAGVLVAAVCACLLFFFVAAAYSCQHAWHFKKLKKHLDADMEEISARLALMSSMGAEHFHDTKAAAGGVGPEKGVRRGDHTLRQQNEYCVASMPRKTRV